MNLKKLLIILFFLQIFINTTFAVDTGKYEYFKKNVGIGTTTPTEKLEVAGNVKLTGSGTTITTDSTELVLSQTGDVLGETRLRLQNRAGSNGALFESVALDLVDFAFKPSEGPQNNIRLEHREEYISGGNTGGEFQFLESSTGDIWFRTGENATIVATGNVGIGTETPTEKLEVAGNIKATAFIGDGALLTNINYAETDPTITMSTSNYVPKWNGTNLVDSSIFDDGNVGIGTETPTSSLSVLNDVNVSRSGSPIFPNRLVTDSEMFYMYVDDSSVNFFSEQNENSASNGNFIFYIDDDGTSIPYFSINNKTDQSNSLLKVSSSGEVGVGTTNPLARLHAKTFTSSDNNIAQNTNLPINFPSANVIAGSIISDFTNTAGYNAIGSQVDNIYQGGLNYTAIGFSASRISSGGNAYGLLVDDIKTNNSSTSGDAFGLRINNINVDGTNPGQFAYGLYLFDITNTNIPNNKYSIYSATDANSYFNGNIGIGTTTPTEKLEVDGNIKANELIVSTITGNSPIYLDGNLVYGDTIYITKQSDFPDQNDDFIFINEKKYQIVVSSITISKYIVSRPGASGEISGLGFSLTDVWFVGGTDYAVLNSTDTNSSLRLQEFEVHCSTNTDILNINTNKATALTYFHSDGGKNIGTIDNAVLNVNGCLWKNSYDGIFLKNANLISTGQSTIRGGLHSNAVMLDISGSVNNARPANITLTANQGYAINIDSNTIGTGNFSNVDVSASANVFKPNSLDEKSINWEFSGCEGINDSRKIGALKILNNTDISTTTASNTWTDLIITTTTLTAEPTIEEFEIVNFEKGEMKYLGNKSFAGIFTVSLSASAAGGANDYQFRLLKNDNPTGNEVLAERSIGSAVGSIVISGSFSASQNDTFKVQFQNLNAANGVTIKHANITLKQ